MANSRKEIRQKKKASGMAKMYRLLAIILIIAGLVILGFDSYEWVKVRYAQKQLRQAYETSAGFKHIINESNEVTITEWQPMRLIIPAINVDLICHGGGDVFDRSLLDKGPTHFQMSDLPSTERGNVAFAGHRAGKWNFFLDIDQLTEGDEIYLDVAGYRFIYTVEWVKVFHETEWSALVRDFDRLVDYFGHDRIIWTELDASDYPAITLQTCEPKHVAGTKYRLIARGAFREVASIPE